MVVKFHFLVATLVPVQKVKSVFPQGYRLVGQINIAEGWKTIIFIESCKNTYMEMAADPNRSVINIDTNTKL